MDLPSDRSSNHSSRLNSNRKFMSSIRLNKEEMELFNKITEKKTSVKTESELEPYDNFSNSTFNTKFHTGSIKNSEN